MKRAAAFCLVSIFFLFSRLDSIPASNILDPIKVKGTVDRNEIGGNALSVVSIWDKQGRSFVDEDGSFSTVISNLRPQKLSVVDNRNKTRALAISFPDPSFNIVFNADSTAAALLFHDTRSFGRAQEVRNFCKVLPDKRSFREFRDFLKKKLPFFSLEELFGDKEYVVLFEKCNSEIFNQDKSRITSSLYEAKKELQEALYR